MATQRSCGPLGALRLRLAQTQAHFGVALSRLDWATPEGRA